MQRLIKTEADYDTALRRAEDLIAHDPEPASTEADELELLTLLIQEYERSAIDIPTPDPIAAIEFRMQQQGLRQRDLIPIIGSRSRVSEVLSGKRPLTLQMIRSLGSGLQIPLDVLLRERGKEEQRTPTVDYSHLPLREMVKRGWLGKFAKTPKREEIERAVDVFLAPFAASTLANATYRRTLKADGFSQSARDSAVVWSARIALKAKECTTQTRYVASNLSPIVMRQLAQLSWFEDGPKRAIGLLRDIGITVVFESALPRSLVDGTAFLLDTGKPVIGLSLRHDRIDYFWFTLLHEVAHVWRHLNVRGEAFIDRLADYESSDPLEREANRLAQESLIPDVLWCRSEAYLSPSSKAICNLAAELHIHPGIVAGRLHHELKNYTRFRNFIGQGTVRRLFIA